jgi:hypothetical protein
MKLLSASLAFGLMTAAAVAASSQRDCMLRMSEDGSLVTLQGVVDAELWAQGTYDMTIETKQGGNRSLSRQAGAFDQTARAPDGFLVLSTTTVYVSEGGRLTVRLNVDDGTHTTSCSLDLER